LDKGGASAPSLVVPLDMGTEAQYILLLFFWWCKSRKNIDLKPSVLMISKH